MMEKNETLQREKFVRVLDPESKLRLGSCSFAAVDHPHCHYSISARVFVGLDKVILG